MSPVLWMRHVVEMLNGRQSKERFKIHTAGDYVYVTPIGGDEVWTFRCTSERVGEIEMTCESRDPGDE